MDRWPSDRRRARSRSTERLEDERAARHPDASRARRTEDPRIPVPPAYRDERVGGREDSLRATVLPFAGLTPAPPPPPRLDPRPVAERDSRRAPASAVDDRFVDEDADSEDEAREISHAPVPLLPPPPPPEHRKLDLPPDMDDDEAMMKLLGFAGFDSTKGKHVADNDDTAARGAVRKVLKREYRQYMHRRGGFNRPLSPSRPIGNPAPEGKKQ